MHINCRLNAAKKTRIVLIQRELDRAIAAHQGGTLAVFSHTGTICILAYT
jgi:hypothetical protein